MLLLWLRVREQPTLSLHEWIISLASGSMRVEKWEKTIPVFASTEMDGWLLPASLTDITLRVQSVQGCRLLTVPGELGTGVSEKKEPSLVSARRMQDVAPDTMENSTVMFWLCLEEAIRMVGTSGAKHIMNIHHSTTETKLLLLTENSLSSLS